LHFERNIIFSAKKPFFIILAEDLLDIMTTNTVDQDCSSSTTSNGTQSQLAERILAKRQQLIEQLDETSEWVADQKRVRRALRETMMGAATDERAGILEELDDKRIRLVKIIAEAKASEMMLIDSIKELESLEGQQHGDRAIRSNVT
jgi:hypothetical protein